MQAMTALVFLAFFFPFFSFYGFRQRVPPPEITLSRSRRSFSFQALPLELLCFPSAFHLHYFILDPTALPESETS